MLGARDFGELIYVSPLKVERLHATLKLPPWKVKSVQAKGGGIGLAVEMDTSRDDLFARLRTVTDHMYRKRTYPIGRYYDRALREGQWFVGQIDAMAYGWGRWDQCREDGPVVFFTGYDDECLTDVVLAGSLQHLLDREMDDLPAARTGSTTERVREVMSKIIAVEDEERDPATVPPIRTIGVSREDLEYDARASMGCIHGFLERGGRHSLVFMGKAINVFPPTEGRNPHQLVVGTPLYVGIASQEVREANPSEPQASSSRYGKLRARWKKWYLDLPQPVAEPPIRRSHPPICVASDNDAPSLDIALYVRPSSAASYASPSDYYDASPRVERGSPDAAAGEIDFSSREGPWFDEQGGEWLVSFSTYEKAFLHANPDTLGEVVATSVGVDATGEVLVLLADVRLGDVEQSLAKRAEAAPRIKWLVDHLPHHATGSDQADREPGGC
jgi:hypothetical protein